MDMTADLLEEVVRVQFVIDCPVDGAVEVSLQDIDTVVLREPERADVIFTCPTCGAEVEITVRIPAFLLSALESIAEESGGSSAVTAEIVAFTVSIKDEEHTAAPEERSDAYCEYFRRQLAGVDTVEEALHEIDSGR